MCPESPLASPSDAPDATPGSRPSGPPLSSSTSSGASSVDASRCSPPSEPLDVSPYEMRDWLVCPVLWSLRRQRWTKRDDDRSTRIIGRAVGAGLTHARQTGDPSSSVAHAHTLLELEWEESREWTLDGAKEITRKSLGEAVKTDLGGDVLHLDTDIGGVRPDVILRTLGGLRVVDDKWSKTIKPEHIQYRVAGQQTDIQLWEYAYRIEQMLGEPVVDGGMHFITANPRPRAWFSPIVFDRARMALWRRDRELVLAQIARARGGEAVAGRWTACLNRDENYGQCPYYDACHTCGRDPQAMDGLYEREA